MTEPEPTVETVEEEIGHANGEEDLSAGDADVAADTEDSGE